MNIYQQLEDLIDQFNSNNRNVNQKDLMRFILELGKKILHVDKKIDA